MLGFWCQALVIRKKFHSSYLASPNENVDFAAGAAAVEEAADPFPNENPDDVPPFVDAGAAAPLPAVFRKSKAPAPPEDLAAAAPKPPKPENILGPSYTRISLIMIRSKQLTLHISTDFV